MIPHIAISLVTQGILSNIALPWVHRVSFLLNSNVFATSIVFFILVFMEGGICDIFVNKGKKRETFRMILFASLMANTLSVLTGVIFFIGDPLHMANRLNPFLLILFSYFVTFLIEGMVYYRFFNTYFKKKKDMLRITALMNLASYIILISLMPFGYLW